MLILIYFLILQASLAIAKCAESVCLRIFSNAGRFSKAILTTSGLVDSSLGILCLFFLWPFQ